MANRPMTGVHSSVVHQRKMFRFTESAGSLSGPRSRSTGCVQMRRGDFGPVLGIAGPNSAHQAANSTVSGRGEYDQSRNAFPAKEPLLPHQPPRLTIVVSRVRVPVSPSGHFPGCGAWPWPRGSQAKWTPGSRLPVSRAWRERLCPKCGAEPGYPCETPSGRRFRSGAVRGRRSRGRWPG
jgi:hypothetical protein